MKKILFLIAIIFITTIKPSLACNLNELDWRNIHLFNDCNFSFDKTKIREFKSHNKGFNHSSKINNTTILTNTSENDNYNQIRAGFVLEKLDWLDFELKKPLEIEEALYYFDTPSSITKGDNEEYDYFNYDYFNLSVNKKHTLVYSLNLFDFSKFKYDKTKLNTILPDIKKLDTFSKIAPGAISEKDFKALFPYLKPHKTTRYSVHSNYDINRTILGEKSSFNKVTYVFKNGLLSFISIIPNDNRFKEFKKNYGPPKKINTISEKFTNCQYTNFSVIIDENNLIKNIGVFSSI